MGCWRMNFQRLTPIAITVGAAMPHTKLSGAERYNHFSRVIIITVPLFPHDTSPCFFGSNYEITALKSAYGIKN